MAEEGETGTLDGLPPVADSTSREFVSRKSLDSHDTEDDDKLLDLEDGLPADFFYSEEAARELVSTPTEDAELPPELATPIKFSGFNFRKYYNLVWMSETEFAFILGHVVCFCDVDSGERRYLPGRDNGGVGAIALSHDRKWIAVGEKSTSGPPHIYIYDSQNLALYRVLRKGTERGYASVQFCPHGNGLHLAALGCAPDFQITIWDWAAERLLLKSKAYGQDVFSVRWGQFPGMLTTVGTGHIRFWKMALTFTGLKLQGDIGKFGATELSDIVGFVELPDGKIVTGSEYGHLLLWEGVFVKVELMRCEDESNPRNISQSPHKGSIEVVMMDADKTCVISGGEDGYLRWWPIDQIDVAEADYDNGILEYGVVMQRQVRIPPDDQDTDYDDPAHIVHLARSFDDSIWLIQDIRNGVVWRYSLDDDTCEVVTTSHASMITGTLVMSTFPGLVLTSGADGTLRAHNMTEELTTQLFVDKRGGGGITCLAAAPDQSTIVCGYEDGTWRAFQICKDGLVLRQAQRPHKSAVKQLMYSRDGKLMASLGVDNSMFFFEVKNLDEHTTPLGFVQLPCKVNGFDWHHTSNSIMLSLEDGSLLELRKPNPELIDNSETFAIQLEYRQVVPELPDEEDEDDEEEGEEGEEVAEGEENVADREEGENGKKKKKKKEAEEEKKEEEDDEDEEGGKEAAKTEITQCLYIYTKTDATALFVGTGNYSGALWEASIDEIGFNSPTRTPVEGSTPATHLVSLHTKLPPGVSVTHMSMSPSARFIFLGFQDGRVWVVPLVPSNHAFLAISVADAINGPINSISCDEDETFLVIGAGDGSTTCVHLQAEELLSYAQRRRDGEEVDRKEAAQQLQASFVPPVHHDPDDWHLPFTDEASIAPAHDIIDPSAYSIQEQKLKSEEDNALAAAEQQKKRVRERIAEYRHELEELQAKSENMPSNQLTRTDLIIDTEHVHHLNQHMEVRIEEVRHELAWSVEFHERGMQKLRHYFLGCLDLERIEVLAFNAPHRVSTFRCPAMSAELQAGLARLHDLIFAADRDLEGDAATSGDVDGLGGIGSSGLGKGIAGTRDMDEVGDGARSTAALSGVQLRALRKEQRHQRRQQRAELEKSKPSDSYEDPQDVDAIAHAEATLGNYMLKTSDTYQVPENQRMNAEKKRRQMFLLEESMHAIKTEFNHRVLALRDFRQQVRTEVQKNLQALKDIDGQLGSTTSWVEGLLDDPLDAPPEFPERRFEYSEADLQAYARSLHGGEEETVPEGQERSDEASNSEDDVLEEKEGDDEDDRGEEFDEMRITVRRSPRQHRTDRSIERLAQQQSLQDALVTPVNRRVNRRVQRLQILRGRVEHGKCSGLGEAVADHALAQLWHDKAMLEEHIKQVIDTFNSAVASIEKEKAKLESDLKSADMKLLVLHEELLTLNQLEEKDETLLKKANACRQDKSGIIHQIKDCQDQLGDKKQEIEHWHEKEQSLQAEFTDLVGETNPHLPALLRIYKKKVKRSKKKKQGEDDDFDEEDDEDDEDSEEDSDEDEDDMDEDAPPQGCDIQVYESVLELRDKRLDMEEALADIQKAVEGLKQTHKKLLESEQRIDKEQNMTNKEIQQFQTDKQRKLNQVEIVFALRLSQVQCLDHNETQLPAELEEHVVFTHDGLSRLMNRITELHREIKDVKANFKQLQRDFRLQKKEKNQKEGHILDLKAKFHDIQMLKFGQIVDLELIEKVEPNKYVQELREKVAEAEREQRKQLAQWDKKIEEQKQELAKITQENTSLMEQIVSMGYSQMQLDAALNARIASVTVNDQEPLNEQRELERERLKETIAVHSKDIATLQAEISLFRKKGGHIYTTVTANRLAAASK